MAGSITSANSVYTLSITGLFDQMIKLQGYAADDIFTTDAVPASEVVMGMDGILSAGMIPAPVAQHITLQADSASLYIFDTWYQSQRSSTYLDLYFAQAVIILPALSIKYTCTDGVLTTYSPLPDAARVLRPRRFTITWESVFPQSVVPATTPLGAGLIVPAQQVLV